MSSDLPAPDLRASHEDRDRVVEALRVAAGDGRLTAEELDARLEAALSAKTFGELAALTADLPAAQLSTSSGSVAPPKDVLVVEQRGNKFVRDGRWTVPHRIELRPRLCDVTLDFTEAVLTSDTLRVEMDMHLGKLFIVSRPGIVVDTDGLTLQYSKTKLLNERSDDWPRLRIELVGTLRHGKVIERRRRRA
ncbi:DUF1707 domain-containing protein [Actinocrinis sp.]|uniref:DUF1707 SHOCT-like domain-containing protein n=1 Tax=Actinocrinis sp. TaxID=1920516 RepID=UPI002D27B771|nr:DUF1707 domain-containing protein [Actinocrinis sp.]HZP54460.1 DUF1707 domain-containing protein [Actinocrinis sp.]